MKATVLLFFILLLSAVLQAQKTNSLSAKVVDASRNISIEGAIIQVLQRRETVSTDERGMFVLQHIANDDSLLISAIGYRPIILRAGVVRTEKLVSLQPQALQLAEMLVSTSRTQTSALVGKLDLPLRGVNNAQEVLRIVPGLFVGQHGGGGKAEQIFLRGFDADHGTDVNLSVDGMPVNMVSHAHGQGYADLHFVIPELVENLQFQKGTYEASKGNFATAGFVAFNTKNRLEQNSVKVEVGQFQTLRTVAQVKLVNTDKHHLYTAAEYGFTNGYFDNPQGFHRVNLWTKYNGRVGQNELTVTASFFESRWRASGQIPERAVASGDIGFFGAIDPTEGGQTGRSNLNVQLTTQLSSGLYLKNQLYFTRYRFDLFSNFTFFLIDSVNGDEIRQREARTLAGYNGSLHRTNLLGRRTLTSEAGIQLRLDRVDGIELSRTKSRNQTLARLQFGDVAEDNAAIYLKESLRWNRFFSLTGGLRYDAFRMQYTDWLNNGLQKLSTASLLSPKLNLSFAPTAKTEVYLSAGKGFHSNDSRVVLADHGRDALPAAYGVDAGVNVKPAKNLFVNAALWRLQLAQEFVYVGDEGVVEPGGRTLRRGADLSVRYQPFQTLFIDADLSYAQARLRDESKGQDYIPLAPTFTSTGGLTYKSKKCWDAGLRYRYMSNRPAAEDYSLTANGYFLVDASTSYITKRFAVTAVVQNLLDARWKETQFETQSRLQAEASPVTEIHFTPGTPFFFKTSLCVFF